MQATNNIYGNVMSNRVWQLALFKGVGEGEV